MTNFILGAGAAIVALLIIGIKLSSKLGKYFFVENISKLDFEESKKIIKKNIEKSDKWVLRGEKDFNDAYAQIGQGNLEFRLCEYKVGNQDHSFRVNAVFPALSVFMPASIAVVEYEEGRVIIYRKNTRLMGCFFSGVIREIMTKEVPKGLEEILEGVI